MDRDLESDRDMEHESDVDFSLIDGVLAPRCGLGLACVPSLLLLTSSAVFGMLNSIARSPKGVFSSSLFARARWIASSQSLFARFVGAMLNLDALWSVVW